MKTRQATSEDIELIENLMKRSMKNLGKDYYSEDQINSCLQFVCVPDRQLIDDKTFFVALDKGKIVGCGGWSFRDKLCAGPKDSAPECIELNPKVDPARIRAMFTDPVYKRQGIGSMILEASEESAKKSGFSKGVLISTAPGLDFYKAKGWHPIKEYLLTLADSIKIKVTEMHKIF